MELALVILFALMAFAGLRLFAVIGGLSLILYLLAEIGDIEGVVNEMYTLATSPLLLTIPLFTFSGYVMAESKTPERLIRLTRALLAPLPGGLAIMCLSACAVFTALTGASGVTIVALGGLLYPVLQQASYKERFALGLLTTSGSIGLLFPPSLVIILYGLVANVSINQLFVAGAIPGVLLIAFFSAYAIVRGVAAKEERRRWRLGEIAKELYASRFELPVPAVVLVGIYGGYLTVTDSAVIVAVYVVIAEFALYRDVPWKRLPEIAQKSMVLVGGIFVIICAAKVLTYYMVDQDVPQSLFEWMRAYIHSKIAFLLLLNGFLLIVGCLMDIFSAILVVVPLIVPIALGFGVDPVHLGIVFLVNLEMGYSTPPVGLNLFIASFRFNKPVMVLTRAALPFLAIMFVRLMVVTYIPELSLALVRLFQVQ